jgi:hypothetical protein
VSEAALECVYCCGQHHLLTLRYTCGTPF